MRKGNLLNSEIISTISKMGHTDQIVVCDAGLPIPEGVNRIDISLVKGLPTFMETLKAIDAEMQIEKIILADEIILMNPAILEEITKIYPIEMIAFINHEAFKLKTQQAKAVIRTGECTPYANIILVSGVTF